MASEKPDVSRRNFLKKSAALGVGAAVWPAVLRRASAASRDRVVIYHSSVADSIHPYNHSSSPIYGNWQHVIEPLVELDYDKKEYVGVLAESWEFQGKQWVFKLRQGVKFHNGAPLTSKDVAFSIEKMRDEKGGSLQAPNFKDVTEVQTPDDQTVVFVTKQPLAIFLDRLENRFIVSKVAGDKFGDQLYQNPIGTGPYKFVSYQRGGNMVFTRNDDYWGGKAAIKEVVFRKVTEEAARLAALESGQADFINNVPVHEVARFQKHPRARIDRIEGLRMFSRISRSTTHWVARPLTIPSMRRPSSRIFLTASATRSMGRSGPTLSAPIRNTSAIHTILRKHENFLLKPDTKMVAMFSSITRPGVIQKTAKFVRWLRRRW
jgi:ABC-type transport system substrate-binding protein